MEIINESTERWGQQQEVRLHFQKMLQLARRLWNYIKHYNEIAYNERKL